MKKSILTYKFQHLTSNKAITLVTLVFTIILILLISGTMGYYTTSGLSLQQVSNMYSDIEQIQSKIDEFYIENNELPLMKQIEKIDFANSINDNDNQNYYIIDLSKLGNMNLNYGKDFEIIKNNKIIGNYMDVYIINEQSHTIYYLKGIQYEKKVYYTKPIQYIKLNDIEEV